MKLRSRTLAVITPLFVMDLKYTSAHEDKCCVRECPLGMCDLISRSRRLVNFHSLICCATRINKQCCSHTSVLFTETGLTPPVFCFSLCASYVCVFSFIVQLCRVAAKRAHLILLRVFISFFFFHLLNAQVRLSGGVSTAKVFIIYSCSRATLNFCQLCIA